MTAKAKKCKFCQETTGELVAEHYDSTGDVYRYRQRMNGKIVAYHHVECWDEFDRKNAEARARFNEEQFEEMAAESIRLGRLTEEQVEEIRARRTR
jgi:hypothetical protein